MNKTQSIFVFLGVLILTSGVTYAAMEYDHRFSFEEPIAEDWDITAESGEIDRTTNDSIHGGYSLSVNCEDDAGCANGDENSIVTKQKGLVSNDNFSIFIDAKYTGQNTFSIYRIDDNSGNYIEIQELRNGGFETVLDSNIMEIPSDNFLNETPVNDRWYTISIIKKGDTISIHTGNDTYTEDVTGNFANPEDTELSINVNGRVSADMVALIDNVRISTTSPSLVAVESTDMLFMIAFLFIILFAAVKLRSAVTLICWFFLALASAAILAFDVSFTIYWITVIIAILGVAISGIAYYAQT